MRARRAANQKPTKANNQPNRDKHRLSSPIERFGQEILLPHLVTERVNVQDHDDGKEDHPPRQLWKR
jgi:hypothetical protein